MGDSLDIRNTTLTFSGEYDGSEEITISNHGLLTGDRVRYVGGGSDNELDINESEYYVKRVDINTIKIANSSANIYNDTYVSFTGNVTDNKFEIAEFFQKSIQSQKLIRKIQNPVSSVISKETPKGKTGIFVNGVEI